MSFACGGAARDVTAPIATPGVADAPAASAQTLTFVKKSAVVGDVREHRERTETSMSKIAMSDTGNTLSQETDADVAIVDRHEQVLAVSPDGAITKLKVTYTESRHEVTQAGATTATKTAVAGNTYVVTANGDATQFTNGDGAAISTTESALVAKDFTHFGRVDPMLAALPARPIAIGESLDDVAKALLADAHDQGVDRVTVHLKESRNVGGAPVGVFAIELWGKLGGGAMQTMKGTSSVRLSDGRELESDAEAPIELSQAGQQNGIRFVLHVKGAFKIRMTNTYP